MVMKNPCHYPDLCATGAFSSSRSDGVNLAVGFNPRVGAIIHPPSRQRRLNPDGGSPTHTTFVVINPWPCPGLGPGRFNRRYATGEIFDPQPWVETLSLARIGQFTGEQD